MTKWTRDFVKDICQVKKIIAISLTLVFCVLSLKGKISEKEFITIFGFIIAFYFGQSSTRQAINENNQSPNRNLIDNKGEKDNEIE